MNKVIDIQLGNVCNYNCMYCHPETHCGSSWVDDESLIEFIRYIKNDDNDVDVILSGGEPTLHPKIERILKDLHEMKCCVILHTNGHKNIKWWEVNQNYIDKIIISYQPEFENKINFYNKLKILSKLKFIRINLSMMIDRFDQCMEVYDLLSKVENVKVTLKALKNNETKRLYDYTKEQLDQIASVNTTQSIIANNQNKYKGWKCWKGIDLIKIIANNDYYLATCDMRYKKKHGNIKDRPINLPTEPVTCEYDYCFCVSDLFNIRKVKQ